MSANSFWQDVKSQIPILKSGQVEPKGKNPETSGRKWNGKFKKRSSSALSIFQVTHKVPSHIVSPKSSKEADSQLLNRKDSRQYNSNIELSRCLDFVPDITSKTGKVKEPHKSYHGSAQDLTMTWWQKKPPTNNNLLCDLKEKSASISNIFYEKENNESSTFFQKNEIPKSLSGTLAPENVCKSYQSRPKNGSFPYQPTLTSNRGMRKQFLSEQNLSDTSASEGEYGLHSLDYSYPYKETYNKMSFDISTIKELPEDRSDSPVRVLDGDSIDEEVSNIERRTCTSLSLSYAETYRSLQNLCMDISDSQRYTSLTETNTANCVASANANPSNNPPEVDVNCFRSVQDLRDFPILEDNSPFSMDYKFINSNVHSSAITLMNDNVKPAGAAETSCFDYWVDNDRSVSMLDITEIGAYRKDFSRRNSSRIPKRRHTVSAHNLDGLSLNLSSSEDTSSRLNTVQQSDPNGNGKSWSSSDNGARLKNSSSIVLKPSCCKKAPTLERKKGCVGCQQKRHQVTRQNSMPLLKNGTMREKTADGRKPLNRSCSNPGPPSRKTQMQAKQQRNTDQKNEKNLNYTNEMNSRSEVERLREEVQSQRRTIRQLSLRLPSESYKENQPLSLGHIPSTSVDNVFDVLLRPSRPRQDASETELQELVNELRAANKNLRSELQETRDQADLLEFRVLELTEGSDRFSEAGKATFSRDAGEKAESPQALNFEDLSLPLSIDSGLDLTADGKQKARNCAVELPVHTESEDSQSATNRPATQLVDTGGFEKDESSSSSTEQTLPTHTEEKQSDAVKFDDSEQQEDRPTDADELPDIISNLQHYLDRPDRLQVTLLATVEKLRSLNSSVSDLEAKISTMTQENQYLTETLSSLNEAQETRTEASGTESEMVNRKTPSLHSDLSDSDSDSPAGDTALAKKRFENLSNFQESGIFEGSNDVHHAATQTEHEEDEAASHSEDNERLHMENSKLHEALEELRQNYDQLLHKDKCSRCLEWAEVDRGESRALKEQLRVSQGARKALYEEKCELEEAENDARLMVQRLDSQLTAAREMELLLSASLSQEQEISRELHKKVKELQYLQAAEKERSFRQSLLEKESMDDRVVNLVLDKDTYMSQLEFVKHSLILLQVFRHFYLLNAWLSAVDGGRAPTEGLEAVDEYVRGSKAVKATDNGHFKERQNYEDINQPLSEFTYDHIVSSQPTLKSTADSELKFSSTFLPLNEMIHQHPKFSEFLMPGFSDVSVQTEPADLCTDGTGASESSIISCPNEIDNLSALSNSTGTMGNVEVQSKSTMTVEKDLLSLREGFYLEQIETLQEEKSALRKEFGQERSLSLEREGLMQATVEELQAQIADSDRARAALQCEIEYLKEKEETLSKDFHKFMEKSRNDQARSSELHEMEKIALRRDFDARLTEVAEDRRRNSERCDDLEHLLSALWRELETAGMGTPAGYEGRPHSAPIPSEGESEAKSRPTDIVNMSCSSNMLDTVRQLVKSENSLRNKITELEKKESAYRETIQEADQIMLSHVTSYKQRIDELEAANELSEAKMKQLECSEDRLRSSLKNSARCDQDVRVAEFLEQLLTIEKSELMLKHKLWSLEKNEKELKIKVIEGEKVQESLRAELRDQDDLLRKMHNLQSENSAITQQLQRAHESVRRAIDKEQTECLLKGRVEELEFSENTLKNTLQQAYAAFAHKERRLNQQVTSLEEEAASLKKRLESASIKETQILDSELTLKRHVEALRAELEDAKRDMKVFSAEESSSRTEVSRLRSQLKQANGELTEVESINCNLRERLAASEQLKETLERSLEERKRRHESDLLQLNLQVSQRESRLEETESQLCELTQLHAAHELDFLAASPLEPVIRATRSITAQLTLCDACSQSHGTAIEDLRLQLDTLTDVLSGAPSHDDTHGEEKKSEQCEASPRATSPTPVPAPRLKRKLKRDFASNLHSSLKNRKKGGSTILEELEEKVRELEESVSTKDEELKLADSETTELSSKLAAAQEIAVSKEAEIFRICQTMTELQHKITVGLENSETEKRIVESRYKEEQDKMKQETQLLILQLKELKARGRMKDYIIGTLVTHIRACFSRSCNIDIIIVEVNRLQEKIKLRDQRGEQGGKLYSARTANEDEALENETDYDVQSVCELLGRPQEVVTLPRDGRATEKLFSQYTEDSAVQTEENLSTPLMVHKQIQTIIESCFSKLTPTPVNLSTSENEPVSVLDLKTDEHNLKNSSLSDSITEASVSFNAGSNNFLPLENVVKSHQIEKQCPTSIHKSTQTSPPHLYKIGPHQKSFIPKIVKPLNMDLKIEVRGAVSSKSNSTSLNFVRGVALGPHKSRTKISQLSSNPATSAAHELNRNHPTETAATHQRATASPLYVSSDVAVPSGEHSQTLRTSVRSTSESGEKKINVPTRSSSSYFQSPDKSIHCTYKKLKVNVVPQERLKPTWQTIRRISGNSSVALKSACEANSNKFIPKPTNLKITRLVGNDGVVIAWELQNQDGVVGFQVIVSGKVVQSVKSPKRTKALITGLSSISSVSIGLVSVGADGRCSKPAVVTYDRSNTNFKNN